MNTGRLCLRHHSHSVTGCAFIVTECQATVPTCAPEWPYEIGDLDTARIFDARFDSLLKSIVNLLGT